MRGFMINKNLSVYYWLRKRTGKKGAYRVAIVFEKLILIFGRGTYERNRTWKQQHHGYKRSWVVSPKDHQPPGCLKCTNRKVNYEVIRRNSCNVREGRKGRNTMFRTMLVEDTPSFRQVVKNSLQDQFPSMDIIEAGDGVEAFQKIDSHPPNLIFMDIHL